MCWISRFRSCCYKVQVQSIHFLALTQQEIHDEIGTKYGLRSIGTAFMLWRCLFCPWCLNQPEVLWFYQVDRFCLEFCFYLKSRMPLDLTHSCIDPWEFPCRSWSKVQYNFGLVRSGERICEAWLLHDRPFEKMTHTFRNLAQSGLHMENSWGFHGWFRMNALAEW